VFLTATLVAGGMPRAVRVRNISVKGALIDGVSLPTQGTSVALRRGDLHVEGEVAWQEGTQCGLRFRTEVTVVDWVRRIGHPGQQRVDRIVSNIRGQSPAPHPAVSRDTGSESLEMIAKSLTILSERLAGDPALLSDHANDLLELDAIAQRLRQLVAIQKT
jgi:hypothetical protein